MGKHIPDPRFVPAGHLWALVTGRRVLLCSWRPIFTTAGDFNGAALQLFFQRVNLQLYKKKIKNKISNNIFTIFFLPK